VRQTPANFGIGTLARFRNFLTSGLSQVSDLHGLSAGELIRRYRRRELSPVEIARDALARVDRFNPVVNAFVLLDRDAALAAATASEARWKQGAPLGLVDGVPATIKDNIWAKG